MVPDAYIESGRLQQEKRVYNLARRCIIRDLLLNVPTPLLALIVVGGSIAVMVFATWYVRRRFPEDTHTANNPLAGYMFAALATIYGVLLAFVVVVVWQQFDAARATVQDEANAAVNLYRFSVELPAPYDSRVRAAVRTYAQAVIDDEWVTMGRGESSSRVEGALDTIWEIHRDIQLANVAMRNSPGSLFDAIIRIGDLRRIRLQDSRTELPGLMWVLLWGGGIIMLGFTLFFRGPNPRAHLIMVGLMTGIVAFVLFLIMELDDPFLGDISVSREPFTQAIEIIERVGGN